MKREERLTDEMKIGTFASLKDKSFVQIGAFKDYDTFFAVSTAVNKLYHYEETNLSPQEITALQAEYAEAITALETKEELMVEYRKQTDELKAENERLKSELEEVYGRGMSGIEYFEKELKKQETENAELKERLAKAVELPFVAMINAQLDDNGNFDKCKAEQSKNGRYTVVFLDKTVWDIPLIDICSRRCYGREFAEARLKELKEKGNEMS